MCDKTLLTMGVTIEYGHQLTTWVVEHVELPIGKTNTPLRKEFPLAPINLSLSLIPAVKICKESKEAFSLLFCLC